MLHRVATSELYRCSPTAIRLGWSFHDFIAAHIVLDHADAERARAEREADHGRR